VLFFVALNTARSSGAYSVPATVNSVQGVRVTVLPGTTSECMRFDDIHRGETYTSHGTW